MSIFQGTPFDIYIHWLILSLGIGVLISGVAVLASCRSIAGFFHLLKADNSTGAKFYKSFYKYHSAWWIVFWIVLVMHLLVTITHIGLPSTSQPYYIFQEVTFITSIGNFVLVLVVLFSCHSTVNFLNMISSKNILNSKLYRRFYKYHAYIWWLLAISIISHIVFGVIHAVNT